jgi:rubrerythrin
MEATKANEMFNNEGSEGVFQNMKTAVQGALQDEMFYDYLISQAPTREEKEIISSIRDDERRHSRLLRSIYEELTGTKISEGQGEDFEKPTSYLEGIKKSLFGELKAVENYRVIKRNLTNPKDKDILFDIITDELKHATKYNYLFTLNSNKNTQTINGSSNNVQPESESQSESESESTNTGTNSEVKRENTADFTPDDWVRYITPLVKRALAEAEEGINPEHLYQEFILAGVFVGLGEKPQEAIDQVEDLEKTGTSKLLAMSKMSRYFDY